MRAFVELAARELRYFWRLILLALVDGYFFFFFGRKKGLILPDSTRFTRAACARTRSRNRFSNIARNPRPGIWLKMHSRCEVATA
jgi:hypothetical protein